VRDEPTWERGRTAPARAVVAASVGDEAMWLLREAPDLCLLPYAHVDGAANASEHAWADTPNRGREASVYLRFIVDHYDNLPDATLFLHGHGDSWHTRYLPTIVRHLDWGRDFSVVSYQPGEEALINAAEGEPGTSLHDEWADIAAHWGELWAEATGLAEPPGDIRFHCCAQFLLSRDAIRRHPRAWYQKALDWVHGGEERFPHGRYGPAHAAILLEFTVSGPEGGKGVGLGSRRLLGFLECGAHKHYPSANHRAASPLVHSGSSFSWAPSARWRRVGTAPSSEARPTATFAPPWWAASTARDLRRSSPPTTGTSPRTWTRCAAATRAARGTTGRPDWGRPALRRIRRCGQPRRRRGSHYRASPPRV
jgi:hypothetical protein